MLITGQNWERLDLTRIKLDKKFGEHVVKKGYAYPKTPTLPQLFNQAGYFTGALIKHGPSPKGLEADFTFTHRLDPDIDRLGGFSGKNPIDESFKFLEAYDASQAKKNQHPYFLYIGFPGPHDERFIDKKYLDMYKEKPSLPENFQETYTYANGFNPFGRDNCLLPHPISKEMIRTELHYYYGIITSIDEHIGRLIVKLKERGEYENTIFVFSSDHGLSLGSHGLVGKQNIYEESMKAPLIIAGPSIPQNKRSDANVYLHDLFATFCDFASISVPAGLHSKSITPILQGKTTQHRETVYLPYGKICSLRRGNFKIIKFYKVERPQLFNLANDPSEMTDLAANPEYAKLLEQMENELQQLRQDHGSKQAWPQKYSHKTLVPISVEELRRKRLAWDKTQKPNKQAKNTLEARQKAGHIH